MISLTQKSLAAALLLGLVCLSVWSCCNESWNDAKAATTNLTAVPTNNPCPPDELPDDCCRDYGDANVPVS